jgi:photosystem II stability/assembly factor-like uncharacterized protein
MRLQLPAFLRWRSRFRLRLAGVMAIGLAAIPSPAADRPGPTPRAAPRMLLLDGARADDAIVAVGERGTILRTGDEAATWQQVSSPTFATLTGVSFPPRAPGQAALRGWAVGHDAVILVTHDAGRTWSLQHQGEARQDSFLDVLALTADSAIAIGAYGLYLSTADGGKTWERRRLGPEDSHFNRLSQGPSGTLYLAGEAGTILRSTDRGATWSPRRTSYQGSFYGIVPLAERTLLAHGLRGRIFRSVDDGATWREVSSPSPALLATGLRTQRGDLVLAGQARTLWVSRDQGGSFTATAEPPTTATAELIPLADGRLLALGEAGATVLPAP